MVALEEVDPRGRPCDRRRPGPPPLRRPPPGRAGGPGRTWVATMAWSADEFGGPPDEPLVPILSSSSGSPGKSGERGVPGTEVVHRDPDAVGADRPEHVQRLVGIGHRRLRHLHRQARRAEEAASRPEALEDAHEGPRSGWARSRARRYRHRQDDRPGAPPDLGVECLASTQEVILGTRPVCSARPMNRSGGTLPCPGRSQRSSASADAGTSSPGRNSSGTPGGARRPAAPPAGPPAGRDRPP